EVKNGEANGTGDLTYNNKASTTKNLKTYSGEFKDNLPHGRGESKYLNGFKYVGNFELAKPHGHGTLYDFNNNLIYTGEFINGVTATEVTYNYNDTSYKVHIKNGIAHGEGILIDPNQGITYKGTLKNNYSQESGTLINNKEKFTLNGQFENSKFNGQGQYSDLSKIYQGEFMKGEFHGHGSLVYKNSMYKRSYKGEFSHGVEDGIGILIDTKGIKYEGTFKNGLKHGNMKVTHPNGAIAYMDFENDEMVSTVESIITQAIRSKK
ncbi:MAG: hypothetical protein ACK5Z5_03160, partial [Neisseriaceae bacterium]